MKKSSVLQSSFQKTTVLMLLVMRSIEYQIDGNRPRYYKIQNTLFILRSARGLAPSRLSNRSIKKKFEQASLAFHTTSSWSESFMEFTVIGITRVCGWLLVIWGS